MIIYKKILLLLLVLITPIYYGWCDETIVLKSPSKNITASPVNQNVSILKAPSKNTATIIVSWCPSSDIDVISYIVRYGIDNNFKNWDGGRFIPTTTNACDGVIIRGTNTFKSFTTTTQTPKTFLKLTSQPLNTTYYFSITALNKYGMESQPSNQLRCTTPTYPNPPSQVVSVSTLDPVSAPAPPNPQP